MNKTVKGSLAGAAGIALLMGGFGSYALWSDSSTMGSSGVTSGTLDVAPGATTFKDQNNANWGPTDLIVPGDTITRTQAFTFSGSGNNLKGRITFAPGAVTNAFGSNLTVTVAATGLSGISGSGGCYEFTVPANANQVVNTTVTYAFSGTTANQASQSVSAAVADGTFAIEQGLTCP